MLKFILSALLLLSPVSHAALLSSPDLACSCNPKVTDPFEEPMRFETTGNLGKCVDSCRFRRPRILAKGEKFRVANVLHEGKFWIAEINPRNAATIDAFFEDFLPSVSHVALRVTFDRPISLRLQTNKKVTAETRELLLSVEAVLPAATGFEFNKARKGDYLLGYRLVTGEEAKRWMLGQKNHVVRVYRLKVNRQVLPTFLQLSLQKSEDHGFQVPYYLFSQNCSTSAFDLLDQATGSKPPTGASWFSRAWPVSAPIGTLAYLKSAGLIESQLPNLVR